jgi:hypothetical protein
MGRALPRSFGPVTSPLVAYRLARAPPGLLSPPTRGRSPIPCSISLELALALRRPESR